MNTLLQQLTEAVGVSGDEYAVRTLLRDLIAPHVDEWRVDALGNLIALKRGSGTSPLRVLVDAHMDEVGFIITAIESDGTLRFEPVGGLSSQLVAGSVVQVGRKQLPGIIGLPPVHLAKSADLAHKPDMSALRIDIGAKDRAAAQQRVSVGDRATFIAPYEEVGQDDIGRSAVGKALDNRAACAMLVTLLRGERYPFDLWAVFSVQEEAGMAGAQVAAHAIRPDVALVLECTPAYDLPNTNDTGNNTELGKGPALYVMDARTVQNPRLVQHLMRSAETRHIPFQIRRPGGGGTNTGVIQRAWAGCPAATIGLPGRHAHTAITTINLRDYAHTLALADAALRDIDTQI
jgi:endoglucanase